MNLRALAVVLASSSACGGNSTKVDLGGDYGGSSGGGTAGSTGSGGDATGGTGASPITIYDEDNYRADISLSIPTVETASGVDLEVCWTDVVSDLDCGLVDPQNEVVATAIMRFRNRSEEEIERVLASSELRQNELDGFLSHTSDYSSTCTTLSSFSDFGTPVDFAEEYVPNDELKYVFLFMRQTISGVASISLTFASPSSESTNRELYAEPGCSMRSLSANLAPPISVPFEGPWLVDFSNVTTDGQGYPFAHGDADSATLWFFAGAAPRDVEGLVSELDELATEHYRFEFLETESVSLTDLLRPADDQPFSGFQRGEGGVWLFGLTCSYCLNPDIPHVLAVFEPVEEL